jgi:NADH-quinone oxidoreductase subunit I
VPATCFGLRPRRLLCGTKSLKQNSWIRRNGQFILTAVALFFFVVSNERAVGFPVYDACWGEERLLGGEAMSILKNIAAIAKGMSITLHELFQPTVVENYPDGPGPLRGAVFQDRFRGVHVLQRDENGLEKCVACFLCAAACPSNCIYIEAAENTAEKRISGAERYAKVYNIDYNRCIFCGYCVEACPVDAITHGHGFEIATMNASNLVYRKEQLLSPIPAHQGAGVRFNVGDSDKLDKG